MRVNIAMIDANHKQNARTPRNEAIETNQIKAH